MKKVFLSLIAVVVLAVSYTLINQHADANPSRLTICQTDSATTTLNYITPGAATTTLSCSIELTDQVDLLVLFRASSTVSELRWRYEYSRDNIDWYPGQEEFVATEATSTVRVPATFTEYSWTYASSTPTSGGNTDTSFKRVQIKDLAARYMRIKFYLPIGSANGAVYAEMLRKEQFR